MSKQVIPVFFSVDDNYVAYLAVALTSMMENASKDYEYNIIIMHQELSEENKLRIRDMEQAGFSFEFVPMEERLKGVTDKLSNKLRCDYFTMTIYFRLFIPDMFPEYDKCVYIDSDVVVPGDISALYNTNLEGNLMGACIDLSIQNVAPLTKYIDEAVGVDHTEYINSGVLLLNAKAMREASLGKRFLELLAKWHFDSIAPDQDYLNAMCFGKIKFLDNSWDVMPQDTEHSYDAPQLIHYNLFAKPWCYANVPYEEYFWDYARKSNFYEELLAYRDGYSNEQKASDDKCFELMAVRAMEIVEKGITFASAFNTGKEKRL